MELTYTSCGDYYIPNLVLSDTKEYHIGKYGRMRQRFLREHRSGFYSYLVLSEKLFPHLAEIDESCRNRMETIIADMAKQEGVTEELKRRDQMLWVGRMNNIHNRAEEIVLHELVYS